MTEKEKLEIEKGNLEAGNPWTKKYFNLSEQGRILKENPAQAEKMQAAAKRIAEIDAQLAEQNSARQNSARQNSAGQGSAKLPEKVFTLTGRKPCRPRRCMP